MEVTRGQVRQDVVRVQTATRGELLPTLAAKGLQTQRFVSSAAAWDTVRRAAFDTDEMTELAKRRRELAPAPTLEKMWAEAIYEETRCRVLPEAPSRLGCLYAVRVGYDAFNILPELGLTQSVFAPSGFPISGPVIIPARTCGRWVAVDMHLFRVPLALAPDELAIKGALAATERLAERYWTGDSAETPITELLCDALDVEGWLVPPSSRVPSRNRSE